MSWAGQWSFPRLLPDFDQWRGHQLRNHTDDDALIGFKKNVNRATTQVMMKTGGFWNVTPQHKWLCWSILIGHVERTNDRDYEIEERYVYAQLWVQ